MMGKRLWLIGIKRLFIASFVVFWLGVLVDRLSNNPEYRDPITSGLVSIAIYMFASLIMMLINSASGAIYVWLFGRKDLVAVALDEMRANRFLSPRDEDLKTFDYFSNLADDEEAPAFERVKAAAYYGSYKALINKGFFIGLALRSALDEAVLRYYQEAPKRRSAPRSEPAQTDPMYDDEAY